MCGKEEKLRKRESIKADFFIFPSPEITLSQAQITAHLGNGETGPNPSFPRLALPTKPPSQATKYPERLKHRCDSFSSLLQSL